MAEPYLQDADATLYLGDCLDVLRELPDQSVHMCCTSPPFFGLRDYGTGAWEGGDEGCDHTYQAGGTGKSTLQNYDNGLTIETASQKVTDYGHATYRQTCGKCGATRIDRQIGLEASPDEWVARLVEVFREVRRVLRDDGTLWVEIGDSYSAGGGFSPDAPSNQARLQGETVGKLRGAKAENYLARETGGRKAPPGYKPKDLLGAPWLLAFALRADGWYLRSEIIWHRPNPMPESVTDRPTKAHSTVFLLSKRPRYFYDAEAIREAHAASTLERWNGVPQRKGGGAQSAPDRNDYNPDHRGESTCGANPSGANARSVWTIPTEPTPFKHFATWPQKLCQRMILAGTSERGVCPECGAPWVREVGEVAVSPDSSQRSTAHYNTAERYGAGNGGNDGLDRLAAKMRAGVGSGTLGWRRSCGCADKCGTRECPCPEGGCERYHPIPATVLDPFAGSGTTLLVARKLGRRSVGIELSSDYAKLAADRLAQQSLLV